MVTKYSFIYTSVPPMTVTSPSFLSFREDDKDFVQAMVPEVVLDLSTLWKILEIKEL